MVHTLKTEMKAFRAVWDGVKRFEYRKADRPFKVADGLLLFEISHVTESSREPGGRSVHARVDYIIQAPSFGIPEGYCIMSITVLERFPAGAKFCIDQYMRMAD